MTPRLPAPPPTAVPQAGLGSVTCGGGAPQPDWDYSDEEDEFDCHMGPDGYCGAAGSEWCDWDCPYSR